MDTPKIDDASSPYLYPTNKIIFNANISNIDICKAVKLEIPIIIAHVNNEKLINVSFVISVLF